MENHKHEVTFLPPLVLSPEALDVMTCSRNEGTFAETALLQSHLLIVSSRAKDHKLSKMLLGLSCGGCPNANAESQRFSYATSQIAVPAPREPLHHLKSQIAARHAVAAKTAFSCLRLAPP